MKSRTSNIKSSWIMGGTGKRSTGRTDSSRTGKSSAGTRPWPCSSTARAGMGFGEFFTPQSNFGGKGPERVGSHPAITAYGVYDMGGNVREWCSNEIKAGRLIRGGAWNDIPYMFGNNSQAIAFDRSPKNGFRCVVYVHPEEIPKSILGPVEFGESPDLYKQEPAPDAVFQVYKEQYSYDKSDLDARVEARDETSKDWIKEKITFAAAYNNEG